MCVRFIVFVVVFSLVACAKKEKEAVNRETGLAQTKIKMVTTLGDFELALSNETPKHRDNFIKLVREKRYDSLLFHRVIENFMVQSGDPESKDAAANVALGEGDLPYTVPAELTASLFNKRGALGAARNGNIARASSAMQFYIVQGRVYTDSTLQVAQGRINMWLAENAVVNNNKEKWVKKWAAFASEKSVMSSDSITLLSARIDSLAAKYLETAPKYEIPKKHSDVYKSVGGAAHLDQNYTVFGEVTKGMNIIDSIATLQTNAMDRPLNDVRILTAFVLE